MSSFLTFERSSERKSFVFLYFHNNIRFILQLLIIEIDKLSDWKWSLGMLHVIVKQLLQLRGKSFIKRQSLFFVVDRSRYYIIR